MARRTSCGVIVTDGSVLLLGHATGSPRWDIPKGLAEPGEDFRSAALRELQEETGLARAARRAARPGRARLHARQGPGAVRLAARPDARSTDAGMQIDVRLPRRRDAAGIRPVRRCSPGTMPWPVSARISPACSARSVRTSRTRPRRRAEPAGRPGAGGYTCSGQIASSASLIVVEATRPPDHRLQARCSARCATAASADRHGPAAAA